MATVKLTKRVVDAAEPRVSRYAIYDSAIPGFGLRIYPTGQKTWVLDYRPGEGGRSTAMKRITIGLAASADGKQQPDFTPEGARREAARLRAIVIQGGDPQGEKAARRTAMTVAELVDLFLDEHVGAKRKASTRDSYEAVLKRAVVPKLGTRKAADIREQDIAKLHRDMRAAPSQANRTVAIVGSMFSYAAKQRIVAKGFNPTSEIEKYPESSRERLLSVEELERLAASIRTAETVGVEWHVDPAKKSKHLRKANRVTVIGEHAAAAIRLLIFTGMRLREVLHLRWDQVDFERGLILLDQHKTSRTSGTKAVVMNSPALALLAALTRIGTFVIAGEAAGTPDEKPRADLKRPWEAVRRHAGLGDLRIHDLRHNFASFGVGGGMGLPMIGKLLGHSQPATTARYAHFDADPLRKASNAIGSAIAAAMGEAETKDNVVVPIKKGA